MMAHQTLKAIFMQYTTKQHEEANTIISSWVRIQKVKTLRSAVPEKFKQVINGKTYNCSTAKHLTSFTYHNDYEEYNTVFEDLYLTPKGEYFYVAKVWSELFTRQR
jgi:hypothetical protein